MLKDSGRETITDKAFPTNIEGEIFTNKLFIRLVAIDKTITKVNFSSCTFDQAYLRNCKFKECDFTGVNFLNSNLSGSSFEGCKFDYSQFDKTIVENDILLSGCPSVENLKLKFARTLRTNFQQLGDADSVNIAIGIELEATEKHLYKSWHSNESYYRKKYKGFNRFKLFLKWIRFKLLDIIWGNGESAWKLFRTLLMVLVIIGLLETSQLGSTEPISLYISAITSSPQILFGVTESNLQNNSYLTVVYIIRLILFSFFMSIIIKRFNRR